MDRDTLAPSDRTLLVGLDAASWNYLDPLLQAGRLPTLRRLMDDGTWGTLRSTMPAQTPPAWASIVTGKNPGKHGIFDHLWRRPGSYEFSPPSARIRRGTPFWTRLNQQRLRVGLVNVPFSHPPDPVDGFVVCGFGTPPSAGDAIYPDDAAKIVEDEAGGYEPWLTNERFERVPPEERLRAERTHQSTQVRIAAHLADRYDVQVLAINLMLFDHANHYMPHMEQVEQALCDSDADLDILIRQFRPDNVLLISDHGSRRVHGTFLLNAWLRDQGYVVQSTRTPQEQQAALNWVLACWLRQVGGWSGSPERLARVLLRSVVPRLPQPLQARFWDAVETSVPFARQHVRFGEQVDHARSSVFPGASYTDLLYMNRHGRDPAGIVAADQAVAFRQELAERLAEIKIPETGQPLISQIYSPEELYSGPAVADAPDLVFDAYDAPYHVLSTYGRGATVDQARNRYFISDVRECGKHIRDGVFIFSGPAFGRGAATARPTVMDVAPTLLHLHGVPVPEDFDGQVLAEAFRAGFMAEHPVSFQQGDTSEEPSVGEAYTADEQEQLFRHLRALGYVE